MKKASMALLSALLVLTGCGKQADKLTSEKFAVPLNGKIDGKDWKQTFGTVRRKTSSDSYEFFLSSLPLSGDPCKAQYVVGETLYFASFSTLKLEPMELAVSGAGDGTIYLTVAKTSTTGTEASSVGAFGEARLTEVTSDQVKGQIDISGNSDNFLVGTFTAKVCPPSRD
jgi:hypothetical protein